MHVIRSFISYAKTLSSNLTNYIIIKISNIWLASIIVRPKQLLAPNNIGRVNKWVMSDFQAGWIRLNKNLTSSLHSRLNQLFHFCRFESNIESRPSTSFVRRFLLSEKYVISEAKQKSIKTRIVFKKTWSLDARYEWNCKQIIGFPLIGLQPPPQKNKPPPKKDGADWKLLGFILGPIIAFCVLCVAYSYAREIMAKFCGGKKPAVAPKPAESDDD